MHVRESHFILTDVPMTALTTLAIWLAVRAARLRRPRAPTPGPAPRAGSPRRRNTTAASRSSRCAAAWLLNERSSPDRLRKLAALPSARPRRLRARRALHGARHAGVSSTASRRSSRGSPGPSAASDPAWLLYVKHLSPPSARFFVPLALAGAAILLWRRETPRALDAGVRLHGRLFLHSVVALARSSARYALPLLPMLCLFASVAVFAALDAVARVPALAEPRRRQLVTAVAIAAVLFGGVTRSGRLARPAAAIRHAGHGRPTGCSSEHAARHALAVENSGPTYLDAPGSASPAPSCWSITTSPGTASASTTW